MSQDIQKTRQIIREVLTQLSSSHEAQYYLEQYSSTDEMRFAVIKVGGGILAERLDDLAASLAVIRHLGLHPIIVHGAGPQIDAAVKNAGIENKKVNGLRVSSEEVMAVARPAMYKANRELVTALEHHQVRAASFLHSVFH